MQKIEFYYPSSDEIHEIHAIIWEPEGDVRAIVQISHGMIEYADRYEEFAEYLTARGILVAGNDHLGHGRSVMSHEEWGFFASGDASGKVVRDLHTLSLRLKKKYPDVPYFLLGHSMGSFMARRYAMTYGKEMDGAIFVGTGNQPKPLVWTGKVMADFLSICFGERYRSKLMKRASFGMYNRHFRPTRTAYDWLSRNQENVDQYCRDEACTFLFTLNGYQTLFSTLLYIEDYKNILKLPSALPMLFLSGEDDPVGDYGKAVKKVYLIYKKCGIKDLSLKLYPEDRHEVMNEIDRKEVYTYLYRWIDKRIK